MMFQYQEMDQLDCRQVAVLDMERKPIQCHLSLVGKSLKIWKVRLRKRINSSPSGNVTAKVRRRSDDAIMATFNESINSTTLDTSFGEYTFTLATPYVLQVGDRIMIEYGGPPAIDLELWNSDKFDGANTRRVRYTTSYSFSNSVDVTGSMSSA